VLLRSGPPPPAADWRAELAAFARAHRRILAAHPWAVAPPFAQPSRGLGAVRIGELALAILRRAGFSMDDSVAIFSGLVALNYGWSSFTAARDLDPSGPSHEVTAMLSALPTEQFPLTVESAPLMGAYGSDEHYGFVLGGFLRGLAG
jgi:hypothetical protein